MLVAAAVLAPAALFPLLSRPVSMFVILTGVAIVWLASRSVVYPVGLVGLPTVVIGAIGHNPLPEGAVTLLIFILTVTAIGFAIARRDNPPAESVLANPAFVFSVALLAVMIARLGYSDAQGYGNSKVELFVLDNLVVLVAGAFVGWRKKHFDLWLLLTLLVSSLGAVVLLEQFLEGQAHEIFPGRFAVSAYENPLGFGQDSASGLIIALYCVLTATNRSLRTLALIVVPVLAVALLSSGSRGPSVGFVAGFVTLLLLMVGDRSIRRQLSLVLVAALASIVLVSSVVPGAAIDRSLSVITGSESGVSLNGRSGLWSQAYDAFAEHPFGGLGTGGFASVAPTERFPHNLFLEFAAELGVIGLVLLGGVLFSGVRSLVATRRSLVRGLSGRASLVLALFVMALINAMLSGDVATNSPLWLAMGLGIGLGAQLREAQRVPVAVRVGAMASGRPGLEGPSYTQ